MSADTWQFWIDVGGTFTDCIARCPDGTLSRSKVMSSGVFQGLVAAGSTADCIVDLARRQDPDDFFVGWRLALVDASGNPYTEATVAGFRSSAGRVTLERAFEVAPQPGAAYELRSPWPAPVVTIRYLLGLAARDPVPSCAVRLGTTRGTNALITRSGAATALVTTRGFGDILKIGYQARPRIFELAICKPEQLATQVLEVDERVAAGGEVLRAPDVEEIRTGLRRLQREGIASLAICLLHADLYPAHERVVARVAEELGFAEISASHEVARLARIVPRGDTTVVNAYLNPVLRDYARALRDHLPNCRLRFLTSAGKLVPADGFHGKDSILSGPAGGVVVGFSRVARCCGFSRAIGFDMGGTSTDVSRYEGQFELEYETEKSGVRISTPSLRIETVAAGGGSICRFDGVKLVVGPESAGADPGPACYGRGGPLAVTDLNFFLGKIPPERFPFPLQLQPVESRLDELAGELANSTSRHFTPVELADGLLRIATASMADAIRTVTVAQGADPREYVLVAFGGAAGQHACAVAQSLGVTRVLCHPDSGILSALGVGLADVARHRSRGMSETCDEMGIGQALAVCTQLAEEARTELYAEQIQEEQIEVEVALDMRVVGTEHALTIGQPGDGDWRSAFLAAHEQLYGYADPECDMEITVARVEVVARSEEKLSASHVAPRYDPAPQTTRTVYFDAQPFKAALFQRNALRPGALVEGPAVITEDNATTVIDPGWHGQVLSGGELLIETNALTAGTAHARQPAAKQHAAKASADDATPRDTQAADPVRLEIFNNRLTAIAQQMGVTLRKTARSVNVKERLDFSCAIFTADGRLVANAPHVPVHLGAMGETVRRILADHPQLRPGDAYVTNDPYRGGSHLPDVTVVSPVHDSRGQLLFFTASRAHHAEIGGMVPGSMPPHSTSLAEEGVVLSSFLLVRGGRSRESELRALLAGGPYPSRATQDNLADIAAQVASNRQGTEELLRLMEEWSWPTVSAYMQHVQDAAADKVTHALAQLPAGGHAFEDYIETTEGESVPIRVKLDLRRPSSTGRRTNDIRDREPIAVIDFAGTGPVISGNLNANRAIVSAAVIYALRLLIDEEIPLNEGVLDPIRILLPECLLNPPAGPTPETCPAVAAGNVETSQRVVDVLLGALGIAAASQGTMNNLIFGNASFGYYETICGGSGATADAPGADAVQVHMTNTRLTDPEILERRYPVRLHQFAIRQGSGGAGRRRGGDGVVRELEFLAPLEIALISQRRGPHPPYRLSGGSPGALGRNTWLPADGPSRELPAICRLLAKPGDRLRIETPGGGGFGRPE